jgi:hypothetical protein
MAVSNSKLVGLLRGEHGVWDPHLNKAVRMRSVRCNYCGNKALMAASQCPKCGHLFEVRDGFGVEVPLSYCTSCDTYYPAHVGMCKWCGTKPQRAPRMSVYWPRIAVGGFLVMASLGGLLFRDSKRKPAAHPRPTPKSASNVARPGDSIQSVVAVAPDAAAPSQDTAARAGDLALPPSPAKTPAVETPVPVVQAPAPVVEAPHPVVAEPAPPKARLTSKWVSLVARSWIVVRADANPTAHIVASIGPDSRVQLGESNGAWRRIRSRDIAGWVDVRRASFAAVRGSLRTSGLASR